MAKKQKNSNNFFMYVPIILLSIVIISVITLANQQNQNIKETEAAGKAVCNKRYKPDVSASHFTTNITNQFMSLPVGRKLIYEGEAQDGRERIVISIPGTTKKFKIGDNTITTLVYRDTVWVDYDDDGKFESNELHEDTRDYLAQRVDTKDVWYFGEDVNNYENGVIASHDGSWLSGRDGAKPGIFVKNSPMRGESFLQECWNGEAEDAVDVLSLNADVRTKMARYEHCVKTYDYTPLDPDSRENKYYCTQSVDGRSVNANVLTVDKTTGNRIELVSMRQISERANMDDEKMGL